MSHHIRRLFRNLFVNIERNVKIDSLRPHQNSSRRIPHRKPSIKLVTNAKYVGARRQYSVLRLSNIQTHYFLAVRERCYYLSIALKLKKATRLITCVSNRGYARIFDQLWRKRIVLKPPSHRAEKGHSASFNLCHSPPHFRPPKFPTTRSFRFRQWLGAPKFRVRYTVSSKSDNATYYLSW